jgi:hypothetical protein
MAAIYSNGDNRWNIFGFNFTKRDALSSVYKISMCSTLEIKTRVPQNKNTAHFIVNIAIFESLLFEGVIHVNVFKLCILTNIEAVFLVTWFIS